MSLCIVYKINWHFYVLVEIQFFNAHRVDLYTFILCVFLLKELYFAIAYCMFLASLLTQPLYFLWYTVFLIHKKVATAANKAVAVSKLLKIATDLYHISMHALAFWETLATTSLKFQKLWYLDSSGWNMLFTWYASKRVLVHSSNVQYGI